MKNCLLLICPKGPRYSEISDETFATYNSDPIRRVVQVSKEIFGNWKFNAKAFKYSTALRRVYVPGGIDETTYHEDTFYAYSNLSGSPVFADRHPFPNLVGASGVISDYNFSQYANKDLLITPRLQIWFNHRDNWYLLQTLSAAIGLPPSHEVDCKLNKIKTIESASDATGDYTYTSIWEIIETFF